MLWRAQKTNQRLRPLVLKTEIAKNEIFTACALHIQEKNSDNKHYENFKSEVDEPFHLMNFEYYIKLIVRFRYGNQICNGRTGESRVSALFWTVITTDLDGYGR